LNLSQNKAINFMIITSIGHIYSFHVLLYRTCETYKLKMGHTRWIIILFLILVFVTGVIALDPSIGIIAISETFVDDTGGDGSQSVQRASECPSLLVKRGNILMLQFSPEHKQEPIFFYNLDEYKNYVDIQQRRGVHCPVLYVQEENNAQGQDVYKMYSSPFYVEGGLPALPMSTAPQDRVQPVETRGRAAQKSVDGKYNRDQFPAFDPYGTYVGVYTDVDAAHDKTQSNTGSFSENAMDPNWGGVIYTQDAVDEGTYVGSTVQKAIYPSLAPK
jgi:hypothetical protein